MVKVLKLVLFAFSPFLNIFHHTFPACLRTHPPPPLKRGEGPERVDPLRNLPNPPQVLHLHLPQLPVGKDDQDVDVSSVCDLGQVRPVLLLGIHVQGSAPPLLAGFLVGSEKVEGIPVPVAAGKKVKVR